MLGPGSSSRAYSDQVGGKPLMQSLNRTIQEQGGSQLGGACPPMLPKNGAGRQGPWGGASNNPLKDWSSGRSGGMMDLDCRNNMPNEYPSALVDQVPAPISDPYRGSGGLTRYHSAPSSLLQSLIGSAELQQEMSRISQLDSSLSSLFTDAELNSLNPSNEGKLEQMEAEHSSNSVFDKYGVMNTRKFDSRLGKSGGPYDHLNSMNSPSKPPMMQPVYKHTMEVLHENVSATPQMGSQLNSHLNSPLNVQLNSQLNSQMPTATQLTSSMGLSSTMGLLGQQDSSRGQHMNLGSIAQNMASDFSCGFPTGSVSAGKLSNSRLAHKNGNNNSLLRQSSSPAGLLAQLSIDVQSMSAAAKNEKQSLSSPNAHSPSESLSGGTSEENGGAGTGPATPGMLSSIDVGGWEDAQSYMNSWDSSNFAARKRFRDMDIDPMVADSFRPDPVRSSQDQNPPPLTRHMSLPAQKSQSPLLTDDMLQSVPCRIRAKRGCATHPRSIAERVRRTRISERMRKLQELVPNMDKQTNTADMLDEAVEYVKQLQRQVQELTESKCNGNCREHKDNNPSS
ncbi:hypothetical protein R1sor_002440 [Riccia sorocarpa]|uniref:BHLH domain-containing protein n=1 Tax=Riccia sorocarpa TaxID=122646 RepID=A0ABD3GZ69_9MARC